MANITVPSDAEDQVGLADWLEASMLASKKKYVPRAAIRKQLKSLLASDDPDISVDLVLREVKRRAQVAKAAYPFREAKSGVELESTSNSLSYLFMLCVATSKPYRDEHRYADTDELFDSIVVDALRKYLGLGTVAVRFGSPASGARPKNFQESIEWLADQICLPKGKGSPRRHSGDGGLDVIAWRPFGDGRSAFIVLLAQCTVQIEWEGKGKDLTEDVWRGWIDFGKSPHLVLAIPFVVSPSHPKWDEVRRTVHTILDRLRVSELLVGGALSEEAAIRTWVAAEIVRMAEP